MGTDADTGTEADTSSIVLLSGGQDSAVCLAWALSRYNRVETVGFGYGQRHGIEMALRPILRRAIADRFPGWKDRLGQDHVLDLGILGEISDTALTKGSQIAMNANGLPNTFVPGRNLLFFTLASALAYRRGIRDLVGGMCQTDYSGYPDCRNDTLNALNAAINLGTAERFRILTPLMWRTKAETWSVTQALGGDLLVETIVEHTHTCYRGDRDHRHAWGYGCGACPACELRAKGFHEWKDGLLQSGLAGKADLK